MKLKRFNEMHNNTMTKEEFIKWMGTTTFSGSGDYWKELVDYGDNSYNEVDIENDVVVFSFEDGDGDTQRREMTFDEFVDRYNRDTLKY